MIAARKVAAQKGRIAVAGLQPLVREVFEISRFHLVVKVHDSVDAGLSALAQPS
jgi:anti-anti-sigma regulatory factor